MIKHRLLRLLSPAVAGRLRAWRVRRLIANYPTRIVRHTYGTYEFRVALTDPLGQGWYDHDWADLPEIIALRGRSLRPGARVFDLGAHQGIVAMMLAQEVGSTGQVIAVEPNPHNAAAAATNKALNNMSQIEIVEAAISDHSGTVVLNEGLDGQLDDGSGAGGRMAVPAMTVDELADRFGMPDLVLIDTEGAECKVLAGATRVLASRVDFAVEVHVGLGLEKLGGSLDALFGYFPPSQFRILARAEDAAEFRPLAQNDFLLRTRFFLLALAV